MRTVVSEETYKKGPLPCELSLPVCVRACVCVCVCVTLHSGYLSFDELLVGLKGQLNERRLDMVKRAFKVCVRVCVCVCV